MFSLPNPIRYCDPASNGSPFLNFPCSPEDWRCLYRLAVQSAVLASESQQNQSDPECWDIVIQAWSDADQCGRLPAGGPCLNAIDMLRKDLVWTVGMDPNSGCFLGSGDAVTYEGAERAPSRTDGLHLWSPRRKCSFRQNSQVASGLVGVWGCMAYGRSGFVCWVSCIADISCNQAISSWWPQHSATGYS